MNNYSIVKVPIDSIRLNLLNPRAIEDHKFQKLVQSIKEAPWMLKIRPIVCNKDGIILGGNQRFLACIEAGLKEVYVINVDDLDDEQQKEFLIKDNLDYGKWDVELIKVNFDVKKLEQWGYDFSPIELNVSSVNDSEVSNFDENDEEIDEKEYDESITDGVELQVKFTITIPNDDATSFNNQLDSLLKGFPRAKLEKRI